MQRPPVVYSRAMGLSQHEEMRVEQIDVEAESLAAEPEGLVADLQLVEHLDGYWPSSKNVSQ